MSNLDSLAFIIVEILTDRCKYIFRYTCMYVRMYATPSTAYYIHLHKVSTSFLDHF